MLRVSRVGRLASAVCGLLMRQELDVYTLLVHTEPSVSERTCHGSGGSSPAVEEAMGQAAPRGFRLSPVCIITPPVLHTHLHLSTSLITRTRGRSLETFQQSNAFVFQISVRQKCTEIFGRPPVPRVPGFFPQRQSGRNVEHVRPCSTGVGTEWSCSSTPLYVFNVCAWAILPFILATTVHKP